MSTSILPRSNACITNVDRRRNGQAVDPPARTQTPLYIFQLEDALKEELSNSSPDPETPVRIGGPNTNDASPPPIITRSGGQATSPSGSNREDRSHGRRPAVKNWHPEEDLILIKCRGEGLPYAEISKKFPIRSDKACQNRYLRLIETDDAANVIGISRAYQDSRERIWSILADQVGVNWQALETRVHGRLLSLSNSSGLHRIVHGVGSHDIKTRKGFTSRPSSITASIG